MACHTVEGNTADPAIPRNNGQSRFAIYKQLHDYKSGARVSDVMTPLVADLSDKQIADLAAFYGRLVRGAIDPERAFPPYVGIDIENLVDDKAMSPAACRPAFRVTASRPAARSRRRRSPASTRNIWKPSLLAFSNSQRHNDIYHRMRSIASRLTQAEMKMLAIYYSGQ